MGFLKNVGAGLRNKAGQTNFSSKVVASIFMLSVTPSPHWRMAHDRPS